VSGGASQNAPPLSDTRQALLVAPARLALGAGGLIAAVTIDLSFAAALAEAALGAGLTIFTLIAPGGRRRPARLRPPATAVSPAQPWWRTLAAAMFPSTWRF